jgi:hypothetical protein
MKAGLPVTITYARDSKGELLYYQEGPDKGKPMIVSAGLKGSQFDRFSGSQQGEAKSAGHTTAPESVSRKRQSLQF